MRKGKIGINKEEQGEHMPWSGPAVPQLQEKRGHHVTRLKMKHCPQGISKFELGQEDEGKVRGT